MKPIGLKIITDTGLELETIKERIQGCIKTTNNSFETIFSLVSGEEGRYFLGVVHDRGFKLIRPMVKQGRHRDFIRPPKIVGEFYRNGDQYQIHVLVQLHPFNFYLLALIYVLGIILGITSLFVNSYFIFSGFVLLSAFLGTLAMGILLLVEYFWLKSLFKSLF